MKIKRLIKDVKFWTTVDAIVLFVGLINLGIRFYYNFILGTDTGQEHALFTYSFLECGIVALLLLFVSAIMMGHRNLWISRGGVLPFVAMLLVGLWFINYFVSDGLDTGTTFIDYVLEHGVGVSPYMLVVGGIFITIMVIGYMRAVIARQKVKRDAPSR